MDTERKPTDGSAPTRVAVYRRTVEASLPRVWENVLDWEHLPWLHHSTFRSIEAQDAGAWGWRARIGLQPGEAGGEILLELCIERAKGRYVARTLEGAGAGTEIWTQLSPRDGAHTDIEVEFLVPGVAPEQIESLGEAYTQLYTRLWDEDEAMMRRREDLLARAQGRAQPGPTLELGSLDALRPRLPLCVELGGRSFRIVELEGELLAHSTVCPHRLGPLEDAPVEGGAIRCPWHGYRYDLRSGRSCDGRRLRLAPAPSVRVDPERGTVSVGWEPGAVSARGPLETAAPDPRAGPRPRSGSP